MADSANFDYVIVGAGTAGCVLAGRLSEDPHVRVCVIEAGGSDSHLFIHTPAMVAPAIATKRINWGFQTTPQPHLNGRKIPQPRGRVVGGSGSINGMVYSRGHPLDYEDWSAAGAVGWDYAHVLPYFIRSENNADYPQSPLHGQDGPIHVRRPSRPNALNEAFITATASLGFPRAADFTGATSEGVGLRQGTLHAGRRVSSARAFLHPALHRGNVALRTDALALRVMLQNRRATGVLYEQDGQRREVRATREVILCAGTLQSPQLLMLSGIGPGEELRSSAIECVLDLPGVGRNFHDH
ncbi:MAG: GMC family oxidoreductase N-terminal domain-containing protein, partial [Sinobacteraceae bacterium]|nr:GMC family oxidoreductase N-terminal domain-containing protein [Nevskiaceae bacterium]